MQFVLIGDYPVHDNWDGTGWGNATATAIQKGEQFYLLANIGLNNFDFPVPY